MNWTRKDAGQYVSGEYEIQRACIPYAGRYPWVIYFQNKAFDSRMTLVKAKEIASRHAARTTETKGN